MKRSINIIIALCVIFALTACGSSTESSGAAQTSNTTSSAVTSESLTESQQKAVSELEKMIADDKESRLTNGYDFYYKSLTITYESSEEDAEFALKDVDWNEMALIREKHGLAPEEGGMSRIMLKGYLESNFSEEQIQYAIENCEADWNEQAVFAVNYRMDKDWSGYTKDEVIDALKSVYGFTQEEAEYGAASLDK